MYVTILVTIGIPLLITVGYLHFKRSPAFRAEAKIMLESNPFVRRVLVNSELTLKLNTKLMELILKMFPNAQFIHIIRDGRDCALSMLERKNDLKIFNVYHAAKTWVQYVGAGQQSGKRLPKDTYFELYYEDLISNPTNKLKEVCNFIGENFEDNMINFKKSQDPNCKTPLLKKPIQSSNSEKWRDKMTTWQLHIFESVAGSTLKLNNYPVSTSCKTMPLPIRALYRAHERYSRWANKY